MLLKQYFSIRITTPCSNCE